MCLKNVRKLFSRPTSITGQLTLFYSASTFILITVISLCLYLVIINILYSADRQFLRDEFTIIKNILESKHPNVLSLKQEVNLIPNSLQSSVYHYYIRVLDKQNNVLAETPNMSSIFRNNYFFNNLIYAPSNKNTKWRQSNAGKHYLLKQSLIKAPTGNKSWLVQMALDVSYQQIIINKYRNIVLIVMFGGALFSIMLGYSISRKGMRSLDELTQTTKRITANDLQQRIDSKFWPKELNELGTAYNQMLDRIEFSITKLVQFSDDLAHELRTPINNLMGEAEIVLSRSASAEEYKTTISSILEELNRIYQIIENILFLARAENPQIDLQKSLLNAAQEINVMCQFYQAVADEKNIKLYCEGNAILSANLIMFRRMIGNLLSNAIKYSGNNSEIYINMKEIENNTVQITITDYGIGMSPEYLPNLFQRFSRADNARNQNTGGTGLGLAIVKSIIDLHQGTISIKSIPNKGTTIIIHFPK